MQLFLYCSSVYITSTLISEKGPLNGCVCVCVSCLLSLVHVITPELARVAAADDFVLNCIETVQKYR